MNKTYEKITQTVIEMLEKGVCPWRKPWQGLGDPLNFNSKREYTGINHLLLSTFASVPYFLTFNQIKKMDGKLNKGSKGMPVIYWNMYKKEDKKTGEAKTIPFLKYYTVFSIEDTDLGYELPELKKFEFKPSERGEKIVENWQDKPEIKIKISNGASYSSAIDRVTMPLQSQFESPEEFYATLFHELGHSTGHQSRLNRPLSNAYGSKAYALEELTAEMTAAFLCSHCGIDNSTIDNSAAYLESWITVLKEDSKILISAASKAQKAANMILGKEEANAERKAA